MFFQEFLSQKGFVHRDLAARNVLVGPNKSCKISDFGLTRLVYEEKVYMGRKSRKLPIKWMSTEAIIDQIFTSYSDVYVLSPLMEFSFTNLELKYILSNQTESIDSGGTGWIFKP